VTGKPGDMVQAATALIIKGIECGSLNADELRASFPDIALDPAELLLVAARFQQMGIRVSRDEADEEVVARVEEIRLAKAIAAGDDVARQQLFETHLRLVPCMAMRRMRLGVSWADLIEAGNRGLVQAIENFDYRKGFSFSKYAAWWVRRAMTGVITRQPPNPNVIPGTIPLATIGDVLDGLTPRQRRILQLRFGLTDGHARPREKVGNASASLPSAWARSSCRRCANFPFYPRPVQGPDLTPDDGTSIGQASDSRYSQAAAGAGPGAHLPGDRRRNRH